MTGQGSTSVVSLAIQSWRCNLLVRVERHNSTASTRIVDILELAVFPVPAIIQLANVPIGPFVLRLLFSHAALDGEDSCYDDDEDTGYDTDGYHDVSPGPDVVERDEALATSGGHIWQGLPGGHT